MTDGQLADFTPALGRSDLTENYDRVIAVMTRERRWRTRLVTELSPAPNETIVDIGSGTGSLAILVKQAAPAARVIALDPDPAVRKIAEQKAALAGAAIEFVTAMGSDQGRVIDDGCADSVISSLVLHQCPMSAKQHILANALRILRPGGRLLLFDYGDQRSLLMQMLFNQVRSLDGYANTKVNKDGRIPEMIAAAGFVETTERWSIRTPTGQMMLWVARKGIGS